MEQGAQFSDLWLGISSRNLQMTDDDMKEVRIPKDSLRRRLQLETNEDTIAE